MRFFLLYRLENIPNIKENLLLSVDCPNIEEWFPHALMRQENMVFIRLCPPKLPLNFVRMQFL